MPNNKFFRVGKKPINAAQFGEILTEELERQQEELLEDIKNFYVATLENLLDNLRAHSADRGLGFYAVRYNDPFEDAQVIARRTAKGWRIRVDSERFNWLDEGRPARTVSKEVRFPGYVPPTATQGVSRGQPGNLHVGNPARIVAVGDFKPLPQSQIDAMLGVDQRPGIGTPPWVTLKSGTIIAARKPRNYYLAIKKIVDAQLAKGRVPGSRNIINPLLIKTIIERR